MEQLRTLIVVGHGMVGYLLVEALRSRDTGTADGAAQRVVVFGEECRPVYDRVALLADLEGVEEDELCLVGDEVHADELVELRAG